MVIWDRARVERGFSSNRTQSWHSCPGLLADSWANGLDTWGSSRRSDALFGFRPRPDSSRCVRQGLRTSCGQAAIQRDVLPRGMDQGTQRGARHHLYRLLPRHRGSRAIGGVVLDPTCSRASCSARRTEGARRCLARRNPRRDHLHRLRRARVAAEQAPRDQHARRIPPRPAASTSTSASTTCATPTPPGSSPAAPTSRA